MSIFTEHSKEFSREAIKARMIKTAAENHGYEHFEVESFDPLVNLLLSSFAKELEKSQLFFEDCYNHILNYLTDRLIPNNLSDYFPAITFVKLNAKGYELVTQDNLKLKVQKPIIKDDKEELVELDFIPIKPFQCVPANVKMIANGEEIVFYNNLQKEVLSRYKPTDSSIWIGIDPSLLKSENQKLQLYYSWFNNPRKSLFQRILRQSDLYVNGKKIPSSLSLIKLQGNQFQYLDLDENLGLDNLEENSYINFQFEADWKKLKFEEHIPPPVKEAMQSNANLSFANELLWLELRLPALKESREMAKDFYCQFNCYPFVNLKKNEQTLKIKAPFKIARLANEQYFIGIEKIESYKGEVYHQIQNLSDISKNYYEIKKEGVLRLNQKSAIESIRSLIDVIKEERNAFASYNPDWIVDELTSIRANLNRIEHKLGEKLNIRPTDIFVELHNKVEEDLVKIKYWTCMGEKANDIETANVFEVQSKLRMEKEAISLCKSYGGRSFISREDKRMELNRLLNNGNRLVTRSDLRNAIQSYLKPRKVHSLTFQQGLMAELGPKKGYNQCIQVVVQLISDHEYLAQDIDILQPKLESFLNENSIMQFPIKVNIKIAENEAA